MGYFFPPTSSTVGAVESRRFVPEHRTTHGEGMAGRLKRRVSVTPGADPDRARGVLLAVPLQVSRRANLTPHLPPGASSMYSCMLLHVLYIFKIKKKRVNKLLIIQSSKMSMLFFLFFFGRI